MRRLAALIVAVSALLAAAVPAGAATRLVIRGAGFGHGVGMSQYGALGAAQQGRSYREILAHYYTDTALGRLDRRVGVRVLLQARGEVAFTGATRFGNRRLDPDRTYLATPAVGGVAVRRAGGRTLATLPAPARVLAGGEPLRLVGGENAGAYRGALELRPGPGGLLAVNAVELEDYVRGVVASESPASWPAEALKAQAVAARTYAITTSKRGPGFDHYADTRSQVYDGVAAERATTDAAIAATRGEVVTHDGRPVVTYFFSTSGGRTENAEFGFPGGPPSPHLKSVRDPWDRVSPRHRWGPLSLTLRQAEARLSGLVRGRLRAIRVIKRGVSPRIVRAAVVGTRGTTPVSGPTLRARFGLDDTWAHFAVIHTRARPADAPPPPATDVGEAAVLALEPESAGTVHGTIGGVRARTRVFVQRRGAKRRWRTVARTRTDRRGRYRAAVERTGRYRVVVTRLPGPAVALR